MTHRWTIVGQRMGAGEDCRSDDLRMRSSGFRYWLLVPLAWVMLYDALVWDVILVFSYLQSLGSRALRRALNRH